MYIYIVGLFDVFARLLPCCDCLLVYWLACLKLMVGLLRRFVWFDGFCLFAFVVGLFRIVFWVCFVCCSFLVFVEAGCCLLVCFVVCLFVSLFVSFCLRVCVVACGLLQFVSLLSVFCFCLLLCLAGCLLASLLLSGS